MLDNKVIMLAIARHLSPHAGYKLETAGNGSQIIARRCHGYLHTFDPAKKPAQLMALENRLADYGRFTFSNFAGEPVASLAPFETKNGRSLFMKSRPTRAESVVGVYYEYFQDEL